MFQWIRDFLRRFLDWLMPGPPHQDDEILEAIKITNNLLRQTEEANEVRHQEMLAAIEKDPVTVSMVWVKKRREKIT